MPVDHKKTIIAVENVSFAYGETLALDNVTLEVHSGDYVGVTGGNGAGKTTLVKLILGLLTPKSGTIKLFGESVESFKGWSQIGYVPQKAQSFDQRFPASVLEIVLMGRYGKKGLFRRIDSNDRAKALEALETVGMSEFKDRLIGDLSGGQQQRVFIARALAGEPSVLILDEPTVGVAVKIKDEFYALLDVLNKEKGITIILIAHDVANIAEHAMHVACLDCTMTVHEKVDSEFMQTHTVSAPQVISHNS